MPSQRVRILLVEDDKKTAKFVGDLLDAAGYETRHFPEANSALEWLKDAATDLVILDIDLPGLSGIQFCRLLKENPATATLPVIMLTGHADDRHKVTSLETGADDYVVKPFSVPEFLARISALLRRVRHQGQVDRVLSSGGVTLNHDTGEVTVNGSKVSLLPKEFALLAMLLSRKGRILTYRFLADEVWGQDAIATRETIKVVVHRLRAKLGACGERIETWTGQGYKWSGET